MPKIEWHKPGTRRYETGTDRGVLYLRSEEDGTYGDGVPWNGLRSVSENPSGAEATKIYADNQVYGTLISAEEFAATIGAYTYPDEFAEMDGSVALASGLVVGQQRRKMFGLSYRTLIGNESQGTDAGYRIHLVYGATAAPSSKDYNTVNDSPEAMELSWELSTEPVPYEGGRNTAHVYIDSTVTTEAKLKEIEDILYGTETLEPRMPLPDELVTLLAAA